MGIKSSQKFHIRDIIITALIGKNMQNISTTQVTNYTALIGIVVLVLNHFHINIGSDEISLLLGSVVAAIGVLSNWYHRYKKGDLTALGSRV